MYSLQIRQLVIVGVDADAEEESRIAPVDDLQRAKFDEVGLVFLIAGGDEAVDLCGGGQVMRFEGGKVVGWGVGGLPRLLVLFFLHPGVGV